MRTQVISAAVDPFWATILCRILRAPDRRPHVSGLFNNNVICEKRREMSRYAKHE